MRLSEKQILNITDKIKIDSARLIIKLEVAGDKSIGIHERLFNIYCVDNEYNIIWQVKELATTPINDWDSFIYLRKEGEKITADRFSGFEYEINPVTGEANQIGFHK